MIIYLDLLFLEDDFNYKSCDKKAVKKSKIYQFLKDVEKLEFLNFINQSADSRLQNLNEPEKMKKIIEYNISKLFLKKLLLQKENEDVWFKEWQDYFVNIINNNPRFDTALILFLRSMIYEEF
jgi:hypothetical protein